MGTDTHAVLEYRHSFSGSRLSLCDGELRLGRDYELFDALAGVHGGTDTPPMFAPRGLPADVSNAVSGLYFDRQRVGDGWQAIPCPDWDSVNWLTAAEVRAALDHSGKSLETCGSEFRAVLAAMDELDRAHGPDSSRLVFWFDN